MRSGGNSIPAAYLVCPQRTPSKKSEDGQGHLLVCWFLLGWPIPHHVMQVLPQQLSSTTVYVFRNTHLSFGRLGIVFSIAWLTGRGHVRAVCQWQGKHCGRQNTDLHNASRSTPWCRQLWGSTSQAIQATMSYLHGAASQEPLLFKPSHESSGGVQRNFASTRRFG